MSKLRPDQAFCQRVAHVSPELAGLLREHIEYYEEILPHGFFGDVSRFAVACLKPGGDRQALQRLLDLIEDGLTENDLLVVNVVYVSFIEHEPAMADMLPMVGPKLAQAIREFGMI